MSDVTKLAEGLLKAWEQIGKLRARVENLEDTLAGESSSNQDEVTRLKEEINTNWDTGQAIFEDLEADNKALRARVEELEAVIEKHRNSYFGAVEKERNKLRLDHAEQVEKVIELAALNDKLRTYQNLLQTQHDSVCGQHQEQAVMIDELRTRLAAVEQLRKDELETYNDYMERSDKHREKLKSRLADEQASYKDLWIDREEIRSRLASYEKAEPSAVSRFFYQLADGTKIQVATAADMDKLVAALKTVAEPTIVKQTYQAVWENGKIAGPIEYRCNSAFAKALGYIRRDTYSDGTVTAVLEPIGEDK